jgi:hypothetical protein
VGSARKRTGHAFEKSHPIVSESSIIKYERPGKSPRILLTMTVMKCHTLWNTEMQTQ